MKKLPYQTRTQTGDVFDIDFPLHEDAGDAVRVRQLISVILQSIDRDLGFAGEMNNGDVLQSPAMVMSIRAGQIKAARYNPPFTIPALRMNEVFIPVKKQ
jgi:hypothetical protein